MKRSFALLPAVVLSLFALLGLPPAPLAAQTPEPVGTVQVGEPLDPAHYGPSYVETLEQALAREQARGGVELLPPAYRDGRPGEWKIPSHGATYFPASGRRYATNRWGDTRMGIGFPSPVDVNGAHFAAQGGRGSWTAGVRVSGYLGGALVRTTAWFGDIGDQPKWLEMNLKNVDRIVVESKPVFRGAGWYALDDLTYTTRPQAAGQAAARVVIDFEDCGYSQTLSGTNYAGLTWETGTGEFDDDEQPPQALGPAGGDGAVAPIVSDEGAEPRGGSAASPILTQSFRGVIRGEVGSGSFPPDTCGAVGPDHFVVVVNRVFAVYNKLTGGLLTNMQLGTFLPGSSGDPRVLYDQYSNRWIIIVSDFSNELYLAVSTSSNANGSYFKTSFVTSVGSDLECFPDYPTLGVDADGIYSGCFMTGSGTCGNNMTIFAIEKAPLISGSPSLGAVTAFRSLPYEQAIQPVHTYGAPATPGEYFVSRQSSSSIRVRRLTNLLTSPTLTTVSTIAVPAHASPADVEALDSLTDLDSIDNRLMNAVYRDGSIWTCHNVGLSGRVGARWYQLAESPFGLTQSGTVDDPTISFWMPSIMVNDNGDAVLGASGSSSAQYVGAYFCGRLAADTLGQMSTPTLMKAGVASQNNIDQFGRNRWGDYSLCSLDPDDEIKMWTIQEYAHATDIWGTWVGRLEFGAPDTLAPQPNPPGFEIPPTPTTTTEITMRSDPLSDDSPPIEHMFTLVSGGSGGNSSVWQTNPNFTDSGLAVNTLYTYNLQSRDTAFPVRNVSALSSDIQTATLIQAPVGLGFSGSSDTTISVTAAGSFTNLAVGMSGLFFEMTPAEGTGANEWVQTTSLVVTGLTPGTYYTFKVKARNQVGIETAFTGTSSIFTTGCSHPGDADGNSVVNGHDVDGFIRFWFGTSLETDNPFCAFFGTFTLEDEVAAFVAAVLAAP